MNKSQWTELGVWLRGYMCLLCKQRIWVQTLVSTWKTAHVCHDSIVGVEGRWIRTCWPANLVEQKVGEGRHQSHALTHSGLYMDTQKCYTLLCMYHTACMCACAYIHIQKTHHWAKLELCYMAIVISAPWMLRQETLTLEASSDA